MLYQNKTFSCPAAPQHVTQEQWDLIFMTKREFLRKYKVTEADYVALIAK